jgi:hypothetical protein
MVVCTKCKTEAMFSIHGRCLMCGNPQFPSKKRPVAEPKDVDKEKSD